MNDSGEKVPNRAGFVQGSTFYIFRSTFRNEISSGYDYLMVVKALDKLGMLIRSGSEQRYTRKKRIGGMKPEHFYVVRLEGDRC